MAGLNAGGAQRKVEIAGAGIGGLTVAAALAQRGWRVTVHERAPDLRTFGAGIYIWSNGLRVLKSLGAYDDATVGAHVGPVFETRDHENRVMEEIPINRPGSARLITILRETLTRSLINRCRESGVEIRTASEVVGATPEGELLLADGTRRAADLIVGADGINSAVRDSLDLLLYRKHLGYGAVRMLIDRADGDVAAVDKDKYIEHFSGSRRILYTPASARHLYIALCCASDDEAALKVPSDRALWCEAFPHLTHLVNRFGDAGRWDAFEVVKLKRWSSGAAAVLGDGAHAMPPYLGQGGGCALMNGLGLAVAVADADDIPAALNAWEARERPLTEHTQEQSERQGDMNLWPDSLRSQVLTITGRSRELAMLRLRTAMHVPTGTSGGI
ncbi:NAD(P)/FAD-dependent oxidoreductase [Nitratireductor aquimarinus]|uniref:FAD-dependent oxidoreductase n=1 Tax=Nitratireductor aquimarinus TaxID=889300 RepID=UPI0029365C55|nr:NAD(P)/FAD-dependent oxidoreductase [Nitratireductor aquimarinus]MDV2966682.1 NAD(P)/FAD-dependent oxidoreductase [Nitratireductor aquimarinus]